MSDNNLLDGFLSEMRASMSQDSRDAMMRRINAERLVKLTLENLLEQHQAESIRVLPDQRLTSQEAADYLVQVDDYDMRLILLDAPRDKPELNIEQLYGWSKLLETNPSTTVVLAVWSNDELSTIPFSLRRLTTILESPEKTDKLLEIAKPFEDVIVEMIQHQTKGWKIPQIEKSEPAAASRDLFATFSDIIAQAIDVEANRRYRTDERLRAAQNFPYQQEKKTILSILQNALDGRSAVELEKRLTTLPRRGGQ
ncbi:MAG: hypothetical protein ABIG63_16830 [Chloroflexota bacterium]